MCSGNLTINGAQVYVLSQFLNVFNTLLGYFEIICFKYRAGNDMEFNTDELHVQRLTSTKVLEKTNIQPIIFFVCFEKLSEKHFKSPF